MWEEIFIFWLATTPLLFASGFWEGAKIYSFFGLIVFVIAIWLIKLKQKLIKSFEASDLLYLFWVLVLLFSSFFSVQPIESLVGGQYRHQGVLFFLGLWMILKTLKLVSFEKREKLLKFLAYSVIFESIFVIIQKLFLPSLVLFERPLGTFGEPNATAGFLAISSVFALTQLIEWKKPIAFTLVFVAIVATGSRSGLFAFFLITAFYIFVKQKTTKSKFVLNIKSVLLLGFVAIVSMSLIQQNFLSRGVSEFENRGVLTKYALEAIKQRPIFGYGAESEVEIYDKYFARDEKPLYDLSIDRSHNLFLDITLWSGVIGLILFMSWLILTVRQKIANRKVETLIGLTGWSVFAFLQPLGAGHWLLLIEILCY